MTSYVVHFSEGVEIPDLSTNQALAEVAHIQSRFKGGYLVSSQINDVNLRQLIMDEYGLTKKDVVIGNMYYQPFSNL